MVRASVVVGTLAAPLLILASVHAQTPLLIASGAGVSSSFAADAEAIGDWDGDGYTDLAVGIPLMLQGPIAPGAVRILSGRDGSTLAQLWGAANQARFGALVAAAGDVDADGTVDLAVGSQPWIPVAPTRVQVFAGGTAALLLDVAVPNQGLATLEGVGDVNADGHADLAEGGLCCGPGGSIDPGRVTVLSGVDGSALYTWCGDATADELSVVSAAGDLDGDGFDDVLAGAVEADDFGPGGNGYVRAFSGRDGSTLYTLDGDLNHNNGFGQVIAPAGDVNADGTPDFLLGVWQHTVGDHNEGEARVCSGLDGAVLLDVPGQIVGQEFGMAVTSPGDVDGDGIPDFAVAAKQIDAPGPAMLGYQLYSGANAALLEVVGVEPMADDLSFVLHAAGDVNGDGAPDLITATHQETFAMLRLLSSTPVLFADLGHGLAGSLGTPQLQVEGVLGPGLPLKLTVSYGKPVSPIVFVVGTSAVSVPFHGGVLVPAPQLIVTGPVTGFGGDLALQATLAGSLPSGLQLFLQGWFKDVGAPTGYSATNAVVGVAP